MPELPEVEVTRRQISRAWKGRVIERVWTAKSSYFFLTPPALLRRRLAGRRTLELTRHGKYILAHLDDGARLLLHLGMTGQLTALPLVQDGHVHFIAHITGGACVSFRDVRKFGKLEYIPPGKTSERLERLGPDALLIEPDDFHAGLRKRSIPIKTALLTQSILAGVGNIYADEALFSARIRPTKPARNLSRRDTDRLLEHIKDILERSIAGGGSTINDYLKPDGRLGGYQDFHQVYGKRGEPCPSCDGSIAWISLGARSTHYCPRCQR